MTSTQILFISLVLDAALKHAFGRIKSMTEEELLEAIRSAEARKNMLVEELEEL